jgi:hypothetical protein
MHSGPSLRSNNRHYMLEAGNGRVCRLGKNDDGNWQARTRKQEFNET